MQIQTKADLQRVLSQTQAIWPELNRASLFITGSSGFFGRWLIDSLLWAKKELNLQTQTTLLVRSTSLPRMASYIKSFEDLYKHKLNITLLEGDLLNFKFPEGEFTHVIHAAAETRPECYQSQPIQMHETIVAGTKRMLEFAAIKHVRRFMYISSGAVYGKFPKNAESVSEDYLGSVDCLNPLDLYANAKRSAENLCSIYSAHYNFPTVIARPFAFTGPHLKLDAHFAICNFISDAINLRDIKINGDGSPLRSYLYGSDLASWLWAILIRGKAGTAYNVGSDQAISIKDLAMLIRDKLAPEIQVSIGEAEADNRDRSCYVPCIKRAKEELGLAVYTRLEDAISSTYEWAKIYK